MKSRKFKIDKNFRQGSRNPNKRMWITRQQIGEAIHEQDEMRRYRNVAGTNTEKTFVSFLVYGDPIGEYCAGWCRDVGLTSEEAERSLRNRRKSENDARTKGRVSVSDWNRMATV